MVCPKCGKNTPDNSKFCEVCGEKILDSEAESQAVDSPISKGFVKFKSKTSPRKLWIGAAVLLAIVIVIAAAAIIGHFTKDNNAYAYISDGKYGLITDIDKGETIEFASSKSDVNSRRSSLLKFSPDGKYVYYYTKYDSGTKTGNLCRAEYGKLKEDSNKNEKYIEIIATNVELGFDFLNDGSLLYENAADTLYYYNGEESVQVAKNVLEYYTDYSERVAYVAGNEIDGYTLYGIVFADINSKIKLASNFAYVSDCTDLDNILYVKYEDDNSKTLYVVGFEKDTEKVCENVVSIVNGSADTAKTYFTATNGDTISLYDYVDDAYAASDAAVNEPNKNDFYIPKYSYNQLDDSDLSEADYDEIYTSCTNNLYWTRKVFGKYYSMEKLIAKDWDESYANTLAAIQSFIDEFGDTADKDGYILVTDEVKEALKNIEICANGSENEWQWLWLCCTRYQSGTTFDTETYNTAYDEWEAADSRNAIRETLKDEDNDFELRTLYCFENGTASEINTQVMSSYQYNGAILFNTPELVAETIKLEDVSGTYDVTRLFNIDYEAENYVLLIENGAVCRMSASAADTFSENSALYYSDVYFTSNEVYFNDGDGVLYVAPISEGIIGSFTIIADDSEILSADSTAIYYAKGSYISNDYTYFDLYSYSGGTSTRLAKDVLADTILLYDDGTVLAYTGYRSSTGYELTMIDSNGDTTYIGDDITEYIRVNSSMLLYISDGDLYSYDGKEKNMVESDVDWVWCRDSMSSRDVYYG